MRPPRVKVNNGKFFVDINNEIHDIDTKLRDVSLVQDKISSQLHVYKTRPAILNSNVPKMGLGKIRRGLSNFDIEKIMDKFDAYDYGFRGVIPSDYIAKIKPSMDPFSFIINVDKSNEPGTHWISIYIDPKHEKELDIFDSFGRDPDDIDLSFQDRLLIGLKQLIDKLDLPYMLKMKMNYLQQQPDFDKYGNPSDTCGYYAMKFILDRMAGESFEEASGVNDVNSIIDLKDSEINKFKQQILQRKYI